MHEGLHRVERTPVDHKVSIELCCEHSLLIDDSSLFRLEAFVSLYLSYNIVLVKRPSPSFGDLILDLIFDQLLVGALGKGRLD
jgi:hypothetical protein